LARLALDKEVFFKKKEKCLPRARPARLSTEIKKKEKCLPRAGPARLSAEIFLKKMFAESLARLALGKQFF
jgi:hypothetical protein